jgi:hypothetical protein
VTAADSKLLESGARVSGTLELEPRASLPDGGTADRFELFVDGVRVAQAGLGERLSLDTSAMADGHHELRVVAITSSRVETQGRAIIDVVVANHDDDRGLELAVEPRRVNRSGTVRIAVTGKGVEGAVVFAMGRVLGRTTAAEESIEVPAEVLGVGPVTIRANGRGGATAADGVNATPVTIEVIDGR